MSELPLLLCWPCPPPHAVSCSQAPPGCPCRSTFSSSSGSFLKTGKLTDMFYLGYFRIILWHKGISPCQANEGNCQFGWGTRLSHVKLPFPLIKSWMEQIGKHFFPFKTIILKSIYCTVTVFLTLRVSPSFQTNRTPGRWGVVVDFPFMNS